MGVIEKPTAAMGPYRVELRAESLYLTREATPTGSVTRPSRYEATVPLSDAAHILAAADQVTRHPHWARGPRAAEDQDRDTAWTLAPGDGGPAADAHWTVTADGARLHLRGPWIVRHETDRNLLAAELRYRDVPELREAVTAAGGNSRSHG